MLRLLMVEVMKMRAILYTCGFLAIFLVLSACSSRLTDNITSSEPSTTKHNPPDNVPSQSVIFTPMPVITRTSSEEGDHTPAVSGYISSSSNSNYPVNTTAKSTATTTTSPNTSNGKTMEVKTAISPVVSASPEVPQLLATEVKTMITNGDEIVIIDVRSSSEFKRGHIPGAISIPLQDLKKRIVELSLQTETIVYSACT